MLRFLQDRRIERLGGRSPITVDARLISATNTDLEQAIAEGRFREDLFYRVGVVTIALPPLRQRGDDVLLIAEACLRRAADEAGRRLPALSKEAVQALLSHEWPGNVRELENRVRRAVVMAEGPRVTAVDLELDVATARRDLRDLRQGVERQTVREALQRNRGNVSRAAAELGISRPTLYDLMKKLRIERD
jgi:two-component system NtrC family response regulator